MKITFDSTALKQSSPSNSDVYITFAAAAAEMTYGTGSSSKTISFTGGKIEIDKKHYGTSEAYSLKEIADNTLQLHSATSLVGFISYGSAVGIEKLPVGAQPNFLSSATPRYSIFEISYNGTSGGADITNISQFGGSIELAFLNGKTVQSKLANSIDTTSMFNALAEASGSSSAAVLLDASGKFIRVIGTNVFPEGPTQNPYPTYNAYLQFLYKTYRTKSVVKELTNLAPGQNPGGAGSAGYHSTSTAKKVTPNPNPKPPTTPWITYNLDYHFTAVASQVTEDSPHGTYKVTLEGYVNATLAAPAEHKSVIKSHKYDGLSIEIAADDLSGNNLYMTNFIYQAATSGAGISVTNGGWDDLNNDFGEATVKAALLQKAAGDFAEGMTCGFPGSSTLSDSDTSKQLGELTSYEWWHNPLLAYEPAQPKDSYYSAYGNVVSKNSSGLKDGSTFSRGGVYGSPYDDRFGLNLISPDANTDEMCITLLADGSLKPSGS